MAKEKWEKLFGAKSLIDDKKERLIRLKEETKELEEEIKKEELKINFNINRWFPQDTTLKNKMKLGECFMAKIKGSKYQSLGFYLSGPYPDATRWKIVELDGFQCLVPDFVD
jgi:hypothetical protein